MNAKSRKTLLVAGLVALAASALIASCGRHHPGPMDPAKIDKYVTFHVDDWLDDLQATDAQRQRIYKVKDELLGEFLAGREQHKATRRLVLAELIKDKPDGQLLHRMLDERLDELRPKLHRGIDALLEVHSTLTAEQRAEIQARIVERHRAWGAR